MKFNAAERSVETNVSIAKREMRLSANAKAFRIILGGIYPDIIKAIVRELFTNAWDSQKSVGKLDIPIEIHSPTAFEPYFAIRDYGAGMSRDLIDNVYSNIFESTKDQSNDEAGTFGMGSKTPLGYMDNFTLISYQDGRYWYYDIYLNEKGVPIVDLKDMGATDEPNGVYVQLAVKSEDMSSFKTNIMHFVFGANTPVKIDGSKFEKRYEVVFDTENYEFAKNASFSVPFVRMGCVLYKIDFRLLFGENFNRHYGGNNYMKLASLANCPLVLKFDIGEFDVTGSREDIIYNADSKKKIIDVLNRVYDDMKDKIQTKIDAAENLFEARNTFITSFNDTVMKVFDGQYVRKEHFTYKGQDLKFKLYNFNDNVIQNINFSASYGAKKRARLSNPKDSIDFAELVVDTGYMNQASPYPICFVIPSDSKLKITAIRSRVNWLVDHRVRGKSKVFIYRGDENHEKFLELKKDIGKLLVLDLETSIIPERKEVEREKKNTRPIVKENCSVFVNSSSFTMGPFTLFDQATFSKYYIPLYYNVPSDSRYTSVEMQTILNFYQDTVCKDKNIAMLNKKEQIIVEKYGLINIFDDFQDRIAKIVLTDDELFYYARGLVSYQPLVRSSEAILQYIEGDWNYDNVRSEVTRFYANIPKSQTERIAAKVKEIQERIDKLHKAIPLLKFCTNVDYRHKEEYNEIISNMIKEITE